MNFLKSLLSGDETGADSAIFCCLLIVIAIIALVTYDVVWRGHAFDIATFSGSATGAVGGTAAFRRVRDGKSGAVPPPNPGS